MREVAEIVRSLRRAKPCTAIEVRFSALKRASYQPRIDLHGSLKGRLNCVPTVHLALHMNFTNKFLDPKNFVLDGRTLGLNCFFETAVRGVGRARRPRR